MRPAMPGSSGPVRLAHEPVADAEGLAVAAIVGRAR